MGIVRKQFLSFDFIPILIFKMFARFFSATRKMVVNESYIQCHFFHSCLRAFETVDYNLLIGDLSKNTVTGRAIGEVCLKTTRPVLVTRDAVDLLLENSPERVLMNQQIVLMASLAQLQKLLRAMYYPKMLTLSQSLVQVAETLHKFTLSYPVKIVTFQGGQILIAESGKVAAVPLEKTGFSPVTLWSGELAVKIMIYNLFNPNNFMDATTSAMF